MEFTEKPGVPKAIRWGDVEIVPVLDWAGDVPDAAGLLPGTARADWERHRRLLSSIGAWDPATDRRALSVHSWVVRVDGMTVVVDTGAGNGKHRPGLPLFDQLTTPYLDDLARCGVVPEQVDVVVNTHLHADHVGWNTRHDGSDWVPTFPDARYLLPSADVDFWNPAGGHSPRQAGANQGVYEDSVRPVLEHGRAETWSDSHRIGQFLTLHAAPGHTPGSSVLALERGDATALFVGDLFHTPLQVVEPHWASCYDEHPALANASRRRVLGHAADTGALVLPAHLPGARALQVGRGADGFVVRRWRTPGTDSASHTGADR